MKGNIIGYDANKRPFRVPEKLRKNHHHVIGASDSGKSKYLEAWMQNDLLSGQGFCLIDPHGTLYHKILKFCAFNHLNREIILLNLSEPDEIIGFNFFERNPKGDVSVQVDSRVQALLRVWNAQNSDQTPTMERILRCVFLAMLEADLTLVQSKQLLYYHEKEIRDRIIDQLKNEDVRQEWIELSNLQKAQDFQNQVSSAKNRLFKLFFADNLMRFLSVRGHNINLLEAMDKQKIVLINLASSSYLSDDNARAFGALFINQVFETAKKRDAKSKDPKPWHLYIDEFQNFVSLDVCKGLDEIRKFGVFFTLAHQRFGHLDEDIQDAVLTNCRIKTVFGGLRVETARMMAEELFLKDIDLLKVKDVIYQVSHRYQETTRIIKSRSSSYSESTGYSSGEGSSSGQGFGRGNSSGETYLADEKGGLYFDADHLNSYSESQSDSFSEFSGSSSFSGESSSSSYSESQGETEVPFLLPEEFLQLSSKQFFSIEEQLTAFTQLLKYQPQRHCFIQLPNYETYSVVVRKVRDYWLEDAPLENYAATKARQCGSITPEEADRRLKIEKEMLKLKEVEPQVIDIEVVKEIPNNEQGLKPVRKKNFFDLIKEQNKDLDL